jgi:hypothetical protein
VTTRIRARAPVDEHLEVADRAVVGMDRVKVGDVVAAVAER